MCEKLISHPSMEHLKVDLVVPSIVAWAPTTPPLDPCQASTNEGSTAPDAPTTHSPESIRHLVPMGDDVDVTGVSLPNLGDMFVVKLCEFLTNFVPTK
jgi:hypothetical protein